MTRHQARFSIAQRIRHRLFRYHVLVDGSDRQCYVAERNLENDPDPGPVDHPLVERCFSVSRQGGYLRSEHLN